MGGRTLIVGASQAGLQLAVSLRDLGYDGAVTLAGEEEHPPYQRPPLSKTFLTGEQDTEGLALRAPGFYREAGIDLLTGERITRVALSPSGPPGSGVATTAAGRTLAFDQLALTVGASPARLPVPHDGLDGVVYLRDLGDAGRLRARLEEAREVVIVGGGFIGLETAAVARAMGKSVTVVEAAGRLLSRAVAPVISEFYRAAHNRRGSTVLLSAEVAGFTGCDGRVAGVGLKDGRSLPADLVLIGIGAVPRTELAEQLGLDCAGGIVVDGYARTSERSVVAAGDCTVQPHPLAANGRIRVESVQNAIAQARVAAAGLLGRYGDTTAVPWFWSDQGDLKLQIAGLNAGYEECVVRGDPETERFSVLYYRGDRLLAIDAVNRPADYMAVRKALAAGATIRAGAAGDETVPLKSLIVDTDVV
ncbi:MAG: ferredoxin [Streptosporangiales bacterium]|nr:ferredoxin [Streptosporangiales bacterium]